MEKTKSVQKLYTYLVIAMIGYIIVASLFFWASGDQLYYTNEYTESVTAKASAAIMENGTTVFFQMEANADYNDYISLLIGTVGRENPGQLLFEMLDVNGTVLAQQTMSTLGIVDYIYQHIIWPEPVKTTKGAEYTIRITGIDVPEGYGVSLWFGDSISTGRFTLKTNDTGLFYVNDSECTGTICFKTAGRNSLFIGNYYWPGVFFIGLMLLLYGIKTINCYTHKKENLILRSIKLFRNYSFLLQQLVSRDFKRKYKRSVLGVLWSFLNPLLTMMVQYLVFSTIFKSTIENFIVYLLSGIVLFNFFSEAVGLGLTSITDNAHLINKVYMPKAVYPLSRTLSAVINLLIALVPLLGATIISGLPITKAILILPFGLLLLYLFSFGLGLFLATSMVYFRDTLFLWSVISTLWAYLTPTFYPISIIPHSIQILFKLNPMYQFISFVRSILLEGIAPSPTVYLGCILSAAFMLAVGWFTFKRYQDSFILHL